MSSFLALRDVATTAAGNEVLWSVVITLVVQMIDLDRVGSELIGCPVKRGTAVVAFLRTRAAGVVKNCSMLPQSSVLVSEWVSTLPDSPVLRVRFPNARPVSSLVYAAVAVHAVVMLGAKLGTLGPGRRQAILN
ncbi:hypothetical protein ACFDR8_000924 [Arthrobacter sp. MP_2.3]